MKLIQSLNERIVHVINGLGKILVKFNANIRMLTKDLFFELVFN